MPTIKNPLVSIFCLTYNHEKFIRETIEGFLKQRTDFLFEIIIHDDASIDATADIIKEYAKKYPEIIKPIYQTENQYSKCHNFFIPLLNALQGKYVAFCEGDDYWTNPLKLQNQIMEMEKNPNCYISFHPALQMQIDTETKNTIIGKYSDAITIIPIEKVIMGGGEFMPTLSILINRLVIPKIIEFFEIANDAPNGDYYIQILGAEKGGALYLPDIMGVYRSGNATSYIGKINSNPDLLYNVYLGHISSIKLMDEYLKNKYSVPFKIVINRLIRNLIISKSAHDNLKNKYIEENIREITYLNRFLWKFLKIKLLNAIANRLFFT